MTLKETLALYIKSRCPLIVLVSPEEKRNERILSEVCTKLERTAYTWDSVEGFNELTDLKAPKLASHDIHDAFQKMKSLNMPSVFFLRDFHTIWKEPQSCRHLKNIGHNFIYTRKNIIIHTHSAESIPDELRDLVEVVYCDLPNRKELAIALDEILKNENIKVLLDEDSKDQLLDAARGLTYLQAQRAFAKAIVQDGSLCNNDVEFIIQEKRSIIRGNDALEFYSVSETPSDVGGLGSLKSWFNMRKEAFSQRARDYGLPAPKGIALIGIPGTGKSLSAKMVGNLWGIPLVRLDVGSLFVSYVGQSEQRTREALKLAEAISPCVLWIDEMEKAFAHGGNDSGTSTRVFGTILTWMSEKTAPCFVIATANDISKLPPELLRRGRFDEIFFLDLPTIEEREAIFNVHIKKRKRDPENFDIKKLVEASSGYVGAELEHAVIDGMYLAFSEGNELSTEYVLAALKRLVPLSIAQRERISELRMWLLEGRAQSASFSEDDNMEDKFVELLDESKSLNQPTD